MAQSKRGRAQDRAKVAGKQDHEGRTTPLMLYIEDEATLA